MSLSFDATFYQSQRPDVYNAFIATAGSTGLTWAQFAQNHYNTFGRFEGSDPSASFNTNYYLNTYPDVAAAGVNPFDHFLANGALEGRAPFSGFPTIANGQFVPATYAAANPDLAAAGITTDAQLYQHFVFNGQFESRAGAPTVTTPSNGETFTLTDGVDTLVGTSFDDTFIADSSSKVVSSAADSIDGGDGTDTIKAFEQIDAVPQISNVEILIADTFAAGKNVDMSGVTGLTSVELIRAVGASTVTVKDGVAVALTSNGATGVDLGVDYGATATSASLTLNDVNSTTGQDVDLVGAKVTTVNIATTGAASSIGGLDVDAAMATVNITGDQALTIVDAVEEAVEVIDGSAMTGALKVITANQATAPDAAVSGVDVTDITVKGGSAADTLDVSNNAADNEVTVDAGAGDDTVVIKNGITYAAATATNAGDSIDGGAGTDILSVDGDLAAADMSAALLNFETLKFTADAAGTNMATNKLGISNFVFDDTVDAVLTGLAAASTLTINGAGTGGDGSTIAATIGTDTSADVLNVNLESTGATTASALTATNYETVNIVSTQASTDTGTITNTLATVGATSATSVVITGSTNLVGGTITAKAAATIDASAFTGDLTGLTLGASGNYSGGTGKDEITVVAGDLKQGNTFAGGAGTDKLTATATADQNAGILGMTGFETLVLATNAAGADTITADFRNVTDLTAIELTGGDAGDSANLQRLASTVVVDFKSAFATLNTTLETGTTQAFKFSTNSAVANITVDAATTSVTITSDDGDATTGEAMGSITGAISGTSLATITIDGNDDFNIGTLSGTVTTLNASASKGNITATASDTVDTALTGGENGDTLTGGAKNDTITGGKGDDTISGAGGNDTIVFADTAANNGSDTLTITAGAGASADTLDFSAFISAGTVEQNGGAGTAINAFQTTDTADVNIDNKLVLYSDAALNGAATAANVAALIQGTGTEFSLSSGAKAIVVTGDDTGANDAAQFWYVDDSLGATAGTIEADDIVQVAITGAAIDLDTLATGNFDLIA